MRHPEWSYYWKKGSKEEVASLCLSVLVGKPPSAWAQAGALIAALALVLQRRAAKLAEEEESSTFDAAADPLVSSLGASTSLLLRHIRLPFCSRGGTPPTAAKVQVLGRSHILTDGEERVYRYSGRRVMPFRRCLARLCKECPRSVQSEDQ